MNPPAEIDPPAEIATNALSVIYIEDDARLARLTAHYLGSHGLVVHLVARGEVALSEVLRQRPDVVLLDIMLPGGDGIEICRKLRERLAVPIIMVTARGEEADRVMGLEVGADDYVSKPFSPRELLARIRAQVRRARGLSGPAALRINVGRLMLDVSAMTATSRGKRLNLTTHEFALLRVLAERSGCVLSREQLLQYMHGDSDSAFDRSIDVHVSRLRYKLEDDPRVPRMLKTIRGFGYMLISEEE